MRSGVLLTPRLLAVAAVVATAVLTASPVQAARVTQMSGEVLGGFDNLTMTGPCTEGSTISFSSSGPAQGPYPGTYTESGEFVIGAIGPNGTDAPVLAFNASFTIVSGSTTITGTKTMTAPSPENIVSCGGVDNPVAFWMRDNVTFDATITEGRRQRDQQGTSHLFGTAGEPFSDVAFSETFECPVVRRQIRC